MKKIIIIFIFTINCLAVFAQKTFYYSLSMAFPKSQKTTRLFIDYEIAGIKFKDSLGFDKKQTTLKKRLTQPVAATIYTNDNDIKSLSVILANNDLMVTITKNSISVNKSKLQDDFLYLTANDRIRPTYFPLYGELSAKNDTIGLNKLSVIFDSLKKDDIQKSLNYFKANKTSLLSLYSFNRYTSFFADYAKIENDFALLPSWAKNSPDGKSIADKIEGAKSTQVNTQAKNFIQISSTGQSINLATLKGKYILLDFWASWCAPCRKEHPNLIKTYEQFKEKNFEIISVSLDSENKNWLDAISKDKLTWTQISDLKGQQNEIAVLYGIQSIPASFLINPEGIIIDKNLKGDELNKRLKTLLDK